MLIMQQVSTIYAKLVRNFYRNIKNLQKFYCIIHLLCLIITIQLVMDDAYRKSSRMKSVYLFNIHLSETAEGVTLSGVQRTRKCMRT